MEQKALRPLGEQTREAREKIGVSVQVAAEYFGISEEAYQSLEAGEAEIDGDAMEKIFKLYSQNPVSAVLRERLREKSKGNYHRLKDKDF